MSTSPAPRGRLVAALASLVVVVALLAPARDAFAQLFGNDEERQRYTAPEAAPAAPVPPPPAPVLPAAAPAATTAPAAPAEPMAGPPAAAPAGGAESLAAAAEPAISQADLEDVAAALRDFENEAREYRNDVKSIIERTFEQRRDELANRFERTIQQYELGEREERLAAIALFERFVARYPADEKYTPDAMTRLAELYFEKNEDDNLRLLAEYEERVKMGASDEPPPEPVKKYGKPIELYQRVLSQFPNYRLNDAVQYLLAFCLGEQGEPESALEEYRLLIQKYPESKYVPEAWVRIGEYYFDYTGPDINEKLREAINAYANAIRYTDGAMYDKALYKLGWAYYRVDDFQNGVDTFVRLIDHYDRLKAEGSDSGGDLRAEALQYTAVSFTDEKWVGVEGEGETKRLLSVPMMVAYFQRIGPRPYEDELYRKLGDMLFDSTKYKESVEAYRIVLAKNPTAADAPKVQERIVTAFARDGNKEQAFAEREKLVQDFGEKSAWAAANKGDQDVLKVARDLVEKALLATAQFHHAQAAEYDKGAVDESRSADDRAQLGLKAIAEYREAAKSYGTYLAEFPHSKNLYEIQYFHAETLFSSGQFAAASEEYAKVRDSNADNKYLANAAYYVVLSLQREIEQQEMQGLLERREPCDPQKCAGVAEFAPVPIPDIRLRLIAAADLYLQKIPTAEDAPILSYKAGQTYFTFFHFDEARKRYEDVIARFADKEVSDYAYEDILITYLLVKDWVNVELFADRQLRESKAVNKDPAKKEAKRLLKYGARFERANALMAAKQWEEASRLYVSIVDDTDREAKEPGGRRWDNADKALYNAAACFVEARRFDSAMRTYERLFTEIPGSPLAQPALFYVAANAEKAFDFEKAIDKYMLLVDQYPSSDKRVAALFNAGQLLEALQRYGEAAQAYQRYAREFPNEPDAPAQAYQAAVIYQRVKDWPRLIDGLNKFIAQFKDQKKYPGESERIVQARLKIALAQRELKDEKAAQRSFDETIREYAGRGMTKDSYLAAQSAGEAKFWITQAEFDEFNKLKFDPKGRGAKLQKDTVDQLQKLATKLESVKGHFREVFGYGPAAAEWILAALFRIGESDELFAQKLLDSPCPQEIKSELGEDGCVEYRIALEEQVAPILDRSREAYEFAQDRAEELRISNKWTKLTNEKVCANSPAKCKSLKDPLVKFIEGDLSPRPLVEADGSTAVQLQFTGPSPEVVPATAPPPAPAPTGIGAPAAAAPDPASANGTAAAPGTPGTTADAAPATPAAPAAGAQTEAAQTEASPTEASPTEATTPPALEAATGGAP